MTLQPILDASPAVQAHIVLALLSVALGTAVVLTRKGTARHKRIGRIWWAAMLGVAVGSFWIKSNGSFSWIHLLSLVTLVNLVGAIYFIRRGNVEGHKKMMIGNFLGLLVAGSFTVLPSRILGQALFGG